MDLQRWTAPKNTSFALFFSGFDEMSILDLYEGSKSQQSSGFSESKKSRNCSGLGDGGKSRNCSGNSIPQGLVSSGFLSSNPVNIPGTDLFCIDGVHCPYSSKLGKFLTF